MFYVHACGASPLICRLILVMCIEVARRERAVASDIPESKYNGSYVTYGPNEYKRADTGSKGSCKRGVESGSRSNGACPLQLCSFYVVS